MRIHELTKADVPRAAEIIYQAFKEQSAATGETMEYQSVEEAKLWAAFRIQKPGYVVWGASVDDQMVALVLVDLRAKVAGFGPAARDPRSTVKGSVRALILHALSEVQARGHVASAALMVSGNERAMDVYRSVGARFGEAVACYEGPALGQPLPGSTVRPMTVEDVSACNALHVRSYGFPRDKEVEMAGRSRSGWVVEREGRLCGYTTGISKYTHSVGETNGDLAALISAAPKIGGGFFVLDSNTELQQWCEQNGFRKTQKMIRMSYGVETMPTLPTLPSTSF